MSLKPCMTIWDVRALQSVLEYAELKNLSCLFIPNYAAALPLQASLGCDESKKCSPFDQVLERDITLRPVLWAALTTNHYHVERPARFTVQDLFSIVDPRFRSLLRIALTTNHCQADRPTTFHR